MRQIVLDTETTGLEPSQGHRIIEIGCVEVIDRRLTGNNFHQYLQPGREIDAGAIKVHGISNEFLADKPPFSEVAQGFLDYVRGAQLIIHNAPFDTGFLNHELKLLDGSLGVMRDYCDIVDTLEMARKMFPGQRNSLDALCKRYEIDNAHRTLHGALLDAEILAEVYLAMTGGQVSLQLGDEALEDGRSASGVEQHAAIQRVTAQRPPLRVIQATAEEILAHDSRLQAIDASSKDGCLWLQRQPS